MNGAHDSKASRPIRIVGSGPVALAFAGFLMREGIEASRIELSGNDSTHAGPTGTPTRKPADGGPRRYLALSEGSCQLLRRICRVPDGGRIEAIEVALAGRRGVTTIHARDFALDRLGLVVSWTDLIDALQQTLPSRPGQHASTLLPEALVVHAEGAPGEDEVDTLDFAQSALLAEVKAEPFAATIASTAFERFDRYGPLALLPIGTTRDRYSLVWCDPAASCERRAALATSDRPALDAELQHAIGSRLASLSIDSPVEVVALRRKRRRVLARGNSVWIGNASQTLHPVAGQGLNLGLRDAFELARRIGDMNAGDCGTDTAKMLRRFVAERSRDRATTVALTDGLARAFRPASLHGIESALLNLLELAPTLRRPLARTLLFGRRH